MTRRSRPSIDVATTPARSRSAGAALSCVPGARPGRARPISACQTSRVRPARFVLLVATLALAGCSVVHGDRVEELAHNAEPVGPQIEIGSGVGLAGPWTAVIYRERDQLLCVMVREADGIQSGGCGSDTAAGPTVSGNGLTSTTVTGGTSRPEAAAARVTRVDREPVTLDLVLPAAGVTDGIRYYVGVFPGTDIVETVEVLDAAGRVLDSYRVGP